MAHVRWHYCFGYCSRKLSVTANRSDPGRIVFIKQMKSKMEVHRICVGQIINRLEGCQKWQAGDRGHQKDCGGGDDHAHILRSVELGQHKNNNLV